MKFTDILDKYGCTVSDLNKIYDIPVSTMMCWKRGVRTAPPYVLALLDAALFTRIGGDPNGREEE